MLQKSISLGISSFEDSSHKELIWFKGKFNHSGWEKSSTIQFIWKCMLNSRFVAHKWSLRVSWFDSCSCLWRLQTWPMNGANLLAKHRDLTSVQRCAQIASGNCIEFKCKMCTTNLVSHTRIEKRQTNRQTNKQTNQQQATNVSHCTCLKLAS